MTRLLGPTSAPRSHLSEDALTRIATRKLSPARRLLASVHLHHCSQCRARFDQLARVGQEIAEHRYNVVRCLGPLPPARRDLFIQQLDQLLESVPARPWWKPFQMQFGARLPGISTPSLPGMLAMICAGLLLLSIWHSHLPTLSAADFLVRAIASDERPANITGSGVMHRRFRLRTEKKTIEHDAYRDISGRRNLRNDNVDAEDADLAIRLALAGVNWEDPLSAVSFKNWHDYQPNPEDEIHSSGEGLLTISTRLPSTSIAQESLTVSENGFHPVARTIEIRNYGTVEISEVSLDFLSWDRAEHLLSASSPDKSAAPPRSPARTLLPSIVQMNEAELEARLILNQKGADTGEQIEVTRGDRGIQVNGLVEREERKRGLMESLQTIPFLFVTIRSFDDLKFNRSAAVQVMPTEQQSTVAPVSPLEQYFVQQGRGRDELSRISAGLFNSSLSINRSCRSIQQITRRFSADDALSPAAIHARDELLSRILERLLNDLNDQQRYLYEADAPLESAGNEPTKTDASSLDLVHLADLNARATRELISGAAEPSRSEKVLATDVAETISQLRTAALSIIPSRSSK